MMQHVHVSQAKTKRYRYRQTFHIKYFPPNSPQLVIEDLSGRTAQLAKMQVLEIDENVKPTFKELYLMYF